MHKKPSDLPLISIVTPIYNTERFLEKTLDSVIEQTYQNWEHWLVVDANSSDRSSEIAEKYAQNDDRFRVLKSSEYRGVVKNRNAALDAAQGDYIAFLDADDCWEPEKLAIQLKFMQDKEAGISCHSFTPIDEHGQICGPIRRVPDLIRFEDLLGDNSIGCLTVMVRREFLGNRRFQNIKHEDLELWLHLLRNGDVAYGLPVSLALYRVLSHSASSNKFKSALWRWGIYRSLGLPLHRSLGFLAKYTWTAISKRIGK